jgi:hypothetical protein
MEGDFERASFYTLSSGRDACIHNAGHVQSVQSVSLDGSRNRGSSRTVPQHVYNTVVQQENGKATRDVVTMKEEGMDWSKIHPLGHDCSRTKTLYWRLW